MHINPYHPTDQSDVIRFLEGGIALATPAKRSNAGGALIFWEGDNATKVERPLTCVCKNLPIALKRQDLLDQAYTQNQTSISSIYNLFLPVWGVSDSWLALARGGNARVSRLPFCLSSWAAIQRMVDLQTRQMAEYGCATRRTYARIDPTRPVLVAVTGFLGRAKTAIRSIITRLVALTDKGAAVCGGAHVG